MAAPDFSIAHVQNGLTKRVFNLLTRFFTGTDDDPVTATVDLSAFETALNAAQVITVDAFEADNDLLISAAVTAMEAHIDANSTGETVNQGATDLKAAIAAIINAIAIDYADHKTKLATDVSNELPTSATVSIVEVVAAAKTKWETARDAYQIDGETWFNYQDPKCKGEGEYAYNITNPESAITTKIQCTSCGGFGKTNTLNSSVPNWSIGDPEVPET